MGRKAAIVTSPPPSQGMTPAQLETEKDPVYRHYQKPLATTTPTAAETTSSRIWRVVLCLFFCFLQLLFKAWNYFFKNFSISIFQNLVAII